MTRKQLMGEISKRLGKRSLFWLGFRGADASVLLQIPQFSKIFSITAPLEDTAAVSEACLETMLKRRIDLHTYDPDRDNSEEARRLHKLLFTALCKPVVVLTYRPDKFFATAYFPQAEHIEYLGLFYGRQAAFENKPWVESELRKYGVRTVPWSYYGQYNLPNLSRLLSKGPIVMRSCMSSVGGGGAYVSIIREQNETDIPLLPNHDTLYAISRYLEPNIPLNVNACVFQDGTVSLHGPSLQLIGIPSCTSHILGYCGNDFTQIRNLDISILNELETMTVQVGKWLAGMGYLGAFGIDAIEHRGHVYLSEINPRFQNSSVISAGIDEELGRPDMYLNHMAAFFGMAAPPYIPLRELAKQQRRIAQIICYNCCSQAVFRKDTMMDKWHNIDCNLLPNLNVEVVREGMLFRAVVESSVTVNGHSLFGKYETQISGMTEVFYRKTPE